MIVSVLKVLLFILVGIISGIVNTVGGGASLVSYPALLMLGIPPVYANVTNDVALVFSGVGATLDSRQELKGHGKALLGLLPLTIAGSVFGTYLLLTFPSATFQKVAPFFILMAAILIFVPQNRPTSPSKSKPMNIWFRLLAGLLILLVGAYAGYFGAAGGVMMLAIFSVVINEKFAVYNAYKNVTIGASNLIAAIIYIFKSKVYWSVVWPLAIGFFIGGSLGPRIVRIVPSKILKMIVGISAIILGIILFLQAYGFI